MLFATRRDTAAAVGWLSCVGSVLAVLGLSLMPSPFVLEEPGPTFDTLGETSAGPLITVPADVDNTDTDGSLRLLTISFDGSPERPLTWMELAAGYVDPADEILPMSAVYSPGETQDQSAETGRIEMRNSQSAAIAAALLHEGYDVDSDVRIAAVIDGSPAVGLLQEGDEVERVNGDVPLDVLSIRASIARVDGPAVFDIVRDGQPLRVEVTPISEGDQRLVGIYPENSFTFPIDVDIELPDVGGPSAGMMFALGIIDRLSPGALTGGEDWAGTGTISAGGDVGGIGGIRQKMHGAVSAGARWFLAPAVNCDEVVGEIPAGLRVVSVETLDDALTAIETVAEGGDVDALPTCQAPTG